MRAVPHFLHLLFLYYAQFSDDVLMKIYFSDNHHM